MKRWKINKPDETISAEFCKKCDLSLLTLKVMISRGYTEFQQIVDFFSETELSDPFLIKDMQKAVDEIMSAVDNYDLICIYGDYDCDGITSTTILYNYLENMGANVIYYIPERDSGYGLNSSAIKEIADRGVALIITVDNGISAHSVADEIIELGMKLVITDHHQPSETLPNAVAVVNPHRADCTSEYKNLAGVGVALKLCAALDGGNYDMILEQYSDICAVGTIADIVPLTGENRTIVKQGILYMKNTENLGLNFLMDKSKVNRDNLNSTAIAFQIAPRINASGRFGSPLIAVKALLSENEDDSESYVDTLVTLNNQRKDTESLIIEEIINHINENPEILNQRLLVISGKGWHHGVIGIVAAKLLNMYGKPCVLISIEEGGMARGSARSVKGFNIFECFNFAKDLLTQFGGHECAGGLSILEENIPAFTQKVCEFANSLEHMPSTVIECAMLLAPQDLTIENVRGLQSMEPFGAENPQPVFALLGARVDKITSLSQGKHTKLDITYGNVRVQALMFNQNSGLLTFGLNDIIDIAATMDINSYAGRESVNLMVLDCRPRGIKQEKYFAAKDCYEKYMRNESLPQAFLKKINPERKELVDLYKYINSAKEITIDDLYIKLNNDQMNYCKLRLCIDAFVQVGLLEFLPSTQKIKLLPVKQKVDLHNAQVLVDLRDKICKGAK